MPDNPILTAILITVLIANPLLLLWVYKKTQENSTRPVADKLAAAPMIMDTSALIDGRILSVAKTGFLGRTLIISHAVISELQMLADKADAYKRERARYGLDVIARLQASSASIMLVNDSKPQDTEVDDFLVSLAQKYNALLCTTDFNLNKVATIKGVHVVNVNELAQEMRATFIPGEKRTIRIVQKGQDKTQGVGYLPDGTMVVVEQGGKLEGKDVTVVFSRILQTQAGKMMFAKIEQNRPSTHQAKPTVSRAESQKQGKNQHHSSEQTVAIDTQKPKQEVSRQKRNSRRQKQTPEDKLLDSVNKYAR